MSRSRPWCRLSPTGPRPDARPRAPPTAAGQRRCEERGLRRSWIIDEALSLFVKAVLEIGRGRRRVTLDPQNLHAVCELTTPTLTAIEWALQPDKLELSDAALAKMQELVDAPVEPGARLRTAARRRRR